MIVGRLPPSPNKGGLAPACFAISFPVGVLPVKPPACVPELATISPPGTAPPCIKLIAPSGRAASRRHSTRRAAIIDVVGAGFQTTTLPAANEAERYSLGIPTG